MSMNFATNVVVNAQNSLQAKQLKVLSAADSEEYSVGEKGQVLKSDGQVAFWGDQATLEPLLTKTYTNIIATSNDNVGGGFFYLKVRPTTFRTNWHVKVKTTVTVPSNDNYFVATTLDLYGYNNTYSWYHSINSIRSTSYRPIYYNSCFFASETGYNNGCGHWLGINLYNATNPTTLERSATIEVLEVDDCTVEFSDTVITPTDIPNRAANTGWYTSTNTSFTNLNCSDAGVKHTGDANTTSISNLYHGSGNVTADSAVYRYQLLFQKDENKFTPLNNVSNTTGTSKAMLTNVEFDPFGRIYYYASTTTVSANAAFGGSSLFFGYSGIDLRYTFNCGQTLTSHKPLYLVVTPTGYGTCRIKNSTPWTQTLPTTNDGYLYILLGRTYSTYQLALYPYHPVYKHNGSYIEQVLPLDLEVEPMTNVVAMLNELGLNSDISLAPAQAGMAETNHAIVQEG